MSRYEKIICDRCGKELVHINNAQLSKISARIDLFPIGTNRTYASQRIDLCPECYNKFINWFETEVKE